LIDALEFDSDEYGCRVDLQEGEVVRLSDSLLSAVEEGDDDHLADLADWNEIFVITTGGGRVRIPAAEATLSKFADDLANSVQATSSRSAIRSRIIISSMTDLILSASRKSRPSDFFSS